MIKLLLIRPKLFEYQISQVVHREAQERGESEEGLAPSDLQDFASADNTPEVARQYLLSIDNLSEGEHDPQSDLNSEKDLREGVDSNNQWVDAL